jgi:hypothetical protein
MLLASTGSRLRRVLRVPDITQSLKRACRSVKSLQSLAEA